MKPGALPCEPPPPEPFAPSKFWTIFTQSHPGPQCSTVPVPSRHSNTRAESNVKRRMSKARLTFWWMIRFGLENVMYVRIDVGAEGSAMIAPPSPGQRATLIQTPIKKPRLGPPRPGAAATRRSTDPPTRPRGRPDARPSTPSAPRATGGKCPRTRAAEAPKRPEPRAAGPTYLPIEHGSRRQARASDRHHL
ncbi:t111.3 [Tupaiid betaherpesvirus 1]|uniref:T111.3 n=1 Tax=Tupaiid herpesvirus 1 (strain 1) TaxID=10397 RepID=Q91TI9_TUHV1|nr:t111.3 [Tupaiid betaherpesvirus 1]AAK57158.1 t111.3 [Tupaiid betaherpesvirus 1]